MIKNHITGLRALAVAAVLSNLAIVAALALSLPHEAQVFLPIVALVLPLLTAAALDAPVSRETSPVRQLRAPARAPEQRRRFEQAA